MIDRPVWMRGAVSTEEQRLMAAVFDLPGRPGRRLPLSGSLQRALMPATRQIRNIAKGVFPVRAVAFDKTPQSDWALPWHQDRVVAVATRHEVPNYQNWSRKQGVWHCEPPVSVLTRMLFVRIHLDDIDAENGGMEIARGSHMAGLVAAPQAEEVALSYTTELTQAQSGDILILPMLTLHRSLAARVPSARRVLRIDYAASSLPPPLSWAI